MDPDLALQLATLIRGQRWAALATLGADGWQGGLLDARMLGGHG